MIKKAPEQTKKHTTIQDSDYVEYSDEDVDLEAANARLVRIENEKFD